MRVGVARTREARNGNETSTPGIEGVSIAAGGPRKVVYDVACIPYTSKKK